MNILGIETSCDETGLAIFNPEKGIIADIVHSQVDIHQAYGGVVPELASRDHIRRIVPLLDQLFEKAGIKHEEINGVAYTSGPGLIGALLVGAAVGRSLAYGWDVPSVGIQSYGSASIGTDVGKKIHPNIPFWPCLFLADILS